MSRLNGKIALVTGGSRSLGREVVERLAQDGADIILTYRKEKEQAEEVKKLVEGLGRKAEILQVDLNGTAELDRLVGDVDGLLKKVWGRDKLDFLINNAGMIEPQMIEDISEEAYDRQMNTNLKSVLFLTQKMLPRLNDGGRILVVGSGLTRFTFPVMMAYSMGKAALETFARYLAKHVGERKITVNAVAPGALYTDFNRAGFDAAPDHVAGIAAGTALGRVGEAEDVGGVVAFLCSEDGRWITGQRLEVSGGMLI
ncbi:SDR family NAD(P)-dependent oxidoreductase [Emcibacter sp.]|uniref:SDR family NAD(P)-dependent oxidoreductase n=1 Tax=Emcibacter sp. TaxID=1979954 RepID=UPI002AA814E9|nr:SDR family oxidoreductase [Emcibacter sp.]